MFSKAVVPSMEAFPAGKQFNTKSCFRKLCKTSKYCVYPQKSPSVPETEDPQSCTSSGKQLPQENISNKSTDSGSDKQENLPKTHLRLRKLLLQTNDTRLSKDGKRIECLRCGKSLKLDK